MTISGRFPQRQRSESDARTPAAGRLMAGPQGWTDWVTLTAMAAPACFFAVMMVLGFVTPGYDWVSRLGSELSLGSLGWIMITIHSGPVLFLGAALGGATSIFRILGYLGLSFSVVLILRVVIAVAREGIGTRGAAVVEDQFRGRR